MMPTVTALFLAVLGTAAAAPALPFGGLQIKFGDAGVMAVADGAVQRYEDLASAACFSRTRSACLRGVLGETRLWHVCGGMRARVTWAMAVPIGHR